MRGNAVNGSHGSVKGRLIAFTLIVMMFMTTGLMAHDVYRSPYAYKNGDWDGMNNGPDYNGSVWSVVIDFHSHTTSSDGVLTPEQNIQWHIAHGFNAAVITDHNTISGALAARDIARARYNDSFKVIIGMEWTTERIHMNIIGTSDDFVRHFSWMGNHVPSHPSDDDIRQVIHDAHAVGGVVMVNHYPRSVDDGADIPSRTELIEWGIDYFEIVNSKNAKEMGYDIDSFNIAQGYGIGLATGSDMHDPAGMNVHGWTLLNATTFTEEAIMEEILERRTTIIYNASGAPYNAEHDPDMVYTSLGPLIAFGGMMKSYSEWPYLNYRSIALLFAYIYSIFVITEGSSRAVSALGKRWRTRRITPVVNRTFPGRTS